MSLELNATLREDKGKGASRRLRHANTLPGILYGGSKDPVSITLQQKDVQYRLPDESFYSQVLSLNIEGKKEDVLVRDIQHHPYKMDVMHMDFTVGSQWSLTVLPNQTWDAISATQAWFGRRFKNH